MSEKIRIGENEYTLGFDSTLARWAVVPVDANHNVVDIVDNLSALNELASLRTENAALKAKVEEFHAVFDKWWEHYSGSQPNATKQEGWGWVEDAWSDLKKVAGLDKKRYDICPSCECSKEDCDNTKAQGRVKCCPDCSHKERPDD